jgi:YfiR/HmsC-like
MPPAARKRSGTGLITAIAVLVLPLACVTGAAGAVAVGPQSPEYLIKAAYLYRFAMFTEWPADSFATPDSPIVLGIVNSDPFGSAIDQTVQGKRISKRRIVVERLNWNQDPRHCHILFVSSPDMTRINELRSRVDGLSILVVGDNVDAGRRGGTINFTVMDNKVGFEINVDAAKRARLEISARLLNLARIVRGG